jgi:hypothetical protein
MLADRRIAVLIAIVPGNEELPLALLHREGAPGRGPDHELIVMIVAAVVVVDCREVVGNAIDICQTTTGPVVPVEFDIDMLEAVLSRPRRCLVFAHCFSFAGWATVGCF